MCDQLQAKLPAGVRRALSTRRPVCGPLFSLLCLTLVTGCGPTPPYATTPISGKVTYEDGSLIPGEQVTVTFVPQTPPIDPRTYPRPAGVVVNAADGTFGNFTTDTYGDGVTLGPAKVVVQSSKADGLPTGAVPAEYSSAEQTPLKVEVTSGHAPYEIKVPKPAQ